MLRKRKTIMFELVIASNIYRFPNELAPTVCRSSRRINAAVDRSL